MRRGERAGSPIPTPVDEIDLDCHVLSVSEDLVTEKEAYGVSGCKAASRSPRSQIDRRHSIHSGTWDEPDLRSN